MGFKRGNAALFAFVGRILAGLLLLFPAWSWADQYERQPAINVLSYEIELDWNDQSDTATGSAKIKVQILTEETAGMWLDFTGGPVASLSAAGAERPFTHAKGRISFLFDHPYHQGQTVEIQIRYHCRTTESGLLAGKNRYGRNVLFAENWPSMARSWFPCIDHPSDKAAVDFKISAPGQYDVVANGRLVETQPLPDGRKLTHWSESVPIPTYCMVLGAAEFSITAAATESGVPLLFYYYSQDRESALRQFRESSDILRFFSRVIGPFPYEKLAQVESTTRFGGMENSSAIFYVESAFRDGVEEDAPLAHEMAHQWFGDSVTPGDWDHLWLSEGFATYFDDLYAEHKAGWNALKERMDNHARAVRKFHRQRPGPIIDPAEKNVARKLNPLNYDKGSWILHMLRHEVGDDTFFRGIRSYYAERAGGNAVSGDFQRAMEKQSGLNLEAFFRQWLYRRGWPQISIFWNWNASRRQAELSIRQEQKEGPYVLPLDLQFRMKGRTESKTIRLSSVKQTEIITLEFEPEEMDVNPGGWVFLDVAVKKKRFRRAGTSHNFQGDYSFTTS